MPKKRKLAFVTHKTIFTKENGKTCHNCQKVSHVKKNFPSKNDISFTPFDSCYVLSKCSNGVFAKFVGTPIYGAKKNAIWVAKALVTNLQAPNLAWVPKRASFAFVGELQGQRKILGS